MAYDKTLSFRYQDLGVDGCLIFVFDDVKFDVPVPPTRSYPIVWRTVHLSPQGECSFAETFHRHFVFATCGLHENTIVLHSATDANVVGEYLEGRNMRNVPQDMALCTGTPVNRLSSDPLWYIPKVGPFETVKVEFTSRLRIYYSPTNIETGKVLFAEMTTPSLWDHSLEQKGLVYDWLIVRNEAGDLEIKPDLEK